MIRQASWAGLACLVALAIFPACGGAVGPAGPQTTLATRADEGGTSERTQGDPTPTPRAPRLTDATPPMPVEEMAPPIASAWRVAAALNEAAGPALMEAFRAEDCSPVLSAWHARADAALAEIEALVHDQAAGTSPSDRAPAVAVRGLANLVASQTLELIGELPACMFARDTAQSESGVETSGDERVDLLLARRRTSFAWIEVVTQDLNDCAYDPGTDARWGPACAGWITDGAPAHRDRELDHAEMLRSLLARETASEQGTCVRVREMWFGPEMYAFASEPPRDEARARASALAEANAARVHLTAGGTWQSLYAAARDDRLVPAASDAVAPELDDVGDPLPRVAEPAEREVPVDSSDRPDAVADAVRAVRGSGPRILEVIEDRGGFVVVERIAVFTPPDFCGQ